MNAKQKLNVEELRREILEGARAQPLSKEGGEQVYCKVDAKVAENNEEVGVEEEASTEIEEGPASNWDGSLEAGMLGIW